MFHDSDHDPWSFLSLTVNMGGTDPPMAAVMADAWAVEPVAPSRLDAYKVLICYLTLSPRVYKRSKTKQANSIIK